MQEINLDVGPAPEAGGLPTIDSLEFQDIAHNPSSSRGSSIPAAGSNIPSTLQFSSIQRTTLLLTFFFRCRCM
jgi:hypothetical protein